MSIAETSSAAPYRRGTIVNLKHVNEIPLRNALETFDKNGDGKIDIVELQKIMYWYGLWKYASVMLCLIIFALVWATFGLTIWAINLTKEYTVTNGVLTGGDEVVKMSVAKSWIPLSWASLLDRRHLDGLESVTMNVTQSSGDFTEGVYHMKLASYLHTSSDKLKLYGKDGSIVWINSGTVILKHPSADEAIILCGAAICNTFAVDITTDYFVKLAERSQALKGASELGSEIDGVAIHQADGKDATIQASTCIMAYTHNSKVVMDSGLMLAGVENAFFKNVFGVAESVHIATHRSS